MSISADDFRDALRHFPAGVTIVTAAHDARRFGLTVSAFTSVSATPPLIAVFIDGANSIHELLSQDRASFVVNVLGHDQRELANRFAFTPEAERFTEGAWQASPSGAPVLEDALCWLDCRVVSCQAAGTHTMVLGAVEVSRVVRPDAPPLLYWNRDYRALAE